MTTATRTGGCGSIVVHGCANRGCCAVAPDRRFALTLREVAPGVVEVPTVACAACGSYLFTEHTAGNGTREGLQA